MAGQARVGGFGGGVLDAAPLLLGMLGPVGAAVGLLGTGFLQQRRKQGALAQRSALIDQATGGGDIASLSLEELANGIQRLQAAGVEPQAGMQDMLDFRQGQQTATRGQQDTVDLQNMQAQQALQAGGIKYGQELGLEAGKDANRWALERFKQGEANARAGLAAGLTPGGGMMGTTPAGHERIPLPGGGVADVPNPGTAAYATAMDPVQKTTYALGAINELRADVAAHGTETFGAGARRQGVLYSQALRSIADLGNAGVLQQGEQEMYQQMLGDPTDKWTGLNPLGARNTEAGLSTLAQLLGQKAGPLWQQSPEGLRRREMPEAIRRAMEAAALASETPSFIPPGYSAVPARSIPGAQ